jgi:DivIVA domain-containing protein
MELTPQTLHAVEFREARRGGYNTRDVDDFIERVASGVGQLNERVREAQARADAAESRLVEVSREADELRRRPAPAAEASETDETLRRTLVLAQRTADATIKEAKEEANRVLSEAREEAARTRAEAEAEARRGADDARAKAQREVETLLTNRDKLKSDLDALSRRIEEQRQQVRSGISELQRVLDDPAALKPVGPVKLADVERPIPLEPPAQAEPAPAGAPAPQGGNGHDVADGPPPFAPGQVAALQESPAPPTQPVPFAVSGDSREPWLPSELRPQGDEPLGPPPAPPGPPAPGNGAPGAATDPASRPSEWGRAVFEPDKADDGEQSRFGRRR